MEAALAGMRDFVWKVMSLIWAAVRRYSFSSVPRIWNEVLC